MERGGVTIPRIVHQLLAVSRAGIAKLQRLVDDSEVVLVMDEPGVGVDLRIHPHPEGYVALETRAACTLVKRMMSSLPRSIDEQIAWEEALRLLSAPRQSSRPILLVRRRDEGGRGPVPAELPIRHAPNAAVEKQAVAPSTG